MKTKRYRLTIDVVRRNIVFEVNAETAMEAANLFAAGKVPVFSDPHRVEIHIRAAHQITPETEILEKLARESKSLDNDYQEN